MMIDLKSISKIFLLKSKALSLSCIGSVMIAVVLIISMLNMTDNAKTSYENKMRSMYGNIDIIATYEGYLGIPETTIEHMKALKEIDQIAVGYFNPAFKINGNTVYMIGSDNSDLLKSRYHYQNDISVDGIAINSVLAENLQRNVNDTVKITGINFRINEIMEDTSGPAVSLAMIIFNQTALTQVLGETPENNFIAIHANNDYKMDYVEKCINSIDGKLNLNILQSDKIYKDSIDSFSIFIKALAICVIIVTGLFVASTMRRFIYKYKHDMAIIRAIGGNKKQVKNIFRNMVLLINFIGCTGGFFVSVLLNKVLLSLINKKMHLIEGDIHFFFLNSLYAAVILLIALTIILLLTIRKSFNILPLEAIMENELSQIGKRNKKPVKKNLYRINRLLDKDSYITIKMMFSRFRENLLLTGTIMIIVVISFIGSSLSSLIQKNNDEYLKQQYPTDIVVTSSSQILFKDIEEYYKQLNKTTGVNAAITLWTRNAATFKDEAFRYLIADINMMQKQGILKNVATSNGIIINKKIADKFNVTVGKYINLLTPQEYIRDANGLAIEKLNDPYEVRMLVSEILPNNILHNTDAFIDINSKDFMQEDYVLDRIFVNGNLTSAEQILSQLKERYPGISWSNYNEVRKMSNDAINGRFIMFEVVVCILILIAGLGWINAIRHTILSRRSEYKILRMHGMTMARLRVMLFKHILIYLFIGIIAGIGVGIAVLMLLTYLVEGASIIVINFNSLKLITSILIVLNLLLIPDVLKVSKVEVVMNE